MSHSHTCTNLMHYTSRKTWSMRSIHCVTLFVCNTLPIFYFASEYRVITCYAGNQMTKMERPFAYHNHPIHTQTQPCAKHGTSVFAKNQLEGVEHYNTNTLEVTTAYDPVRNVHIVCVYRYPSSSIPQFVEDLKEIPATQTKESKVIVGGFNINIQGKNQKTIENLCRYLKTQQLVKKPTTKYNTAIDHIYTNLNSYKSADVLKTYYSDHDQIFIQF